MNSLRHSMHGPTWLYVTVIVLAWLCVSAVSYAQSITPCTMTPPPITACNPACARVKIWPTFLVPPHAPNGTVLASLTVNYSYTCPTPVGSPNVPRTYVPQYLNSLQNSTTVPDVRVAGPVATVGIRTTINGVVASGAASSVDYVPLNWAPNCNAPCSGTATVTYELVKVSDVLLQTGLPTGTDDVRCGGLGYCQVAKVFYDTFRLRDTLSSITQTASPLTWRTWFVDTSYGKMMQTTCTVSTPTTISVTMDPMNAATLSAQGSGGDTGFNIGLTACSPGSTVYITLTDLTQPGNRSDLLNLSPASSATGVKLRILRNGTPVTYGPDSVAPGNPGQWQVGSTTGASTINIPLTVRYVATGAVGGGSVLGAATFTMSYQ